MRRRLFIAVALPVLATLCLTLIVSMSMSSSLPQDMSNSTEWATFANTLSERMQATDTPTRVVLLMGLHMMHIYMCLPMLHITKVLYGFWFGLWVGWSLCCAWECLLFYVFLIFLHKEHHPTIIEYTANARRCHTLFRELVAFAMSSLPLQASASLVQFGDVTIREFMTANMVVTAVMSLKNVLCGVILASSPSPSVLVVLAAVIAFSTVLPTVSTFYVSSRTLLGAMHAHAEDAELLSDELLLDLESDSEYDIPSPKTQPTHNNQSPDDTVETEKEDKGVQSM